MSAPLWYAASANARTVLRCSALWIVACAAGDDTDGSATSMVGGTTDATTTTTTTGSSTSSSTGLESSSTGAGGSTAIGESSATAAGSSTTATFDDAVLLETTLGEMVIQLDPELAPITVANFYAYVDAGFYDGTDGLGATTFHRVAAGFVIQGGGVTEAGVTKATMAPIVNESGNGLTNARGTIAMARTSDPDSATSQFFVNLVDNFSLDTAPGYAVFGHVVEGLDVVDAIGAVPTTMEAPNDPIVILSATRL
jgi:peptidyl-prolyl cis-trans isomerase A (cyclophilin A)